MFIDHPPLTPETTRYIDANTAGGDVNNFTRLWAWRPDVGDAFFQLRRTLVSGASLSKREQAALACVIAATLGDSYCALSFGTMLANASDAATAAAVLRGETPPDLTQREAALVAWGRQVVRDANSTRQADVHRLRGAGFSDREIFEATAFIAFRLGFALVNDALGVQPDWQMAEAAPAAVRTAIDFGRPAAPRP